MFGAEWTVGWDGGGPGIAVWDTTKAGRSGQPRRRRRPSHHAALHPLRRGRRRRSARRSSPSRTTAPAAPATPAPPTAPTAHPAGPVNASRLRPRVLDRFPRQAPPSGPSPRARHPRAVVGDARCTSLDAQRHRRHRTPAGSSSMAWPQPPPSPTSSHHPTLTSEVTTMNEQTPPRIPFLVAAVPVLIAYGVPRSSTAAGGSGSPPRSSVSRPAVNTSAKP